jgi:hypothetical protein
VAGRARTSRGAGVGIFDRLFHRSDPSQDPRVSRRRWTRTEVFGDKYSERDLAEFIETSPLVAWQDLNPFGDRPRHEVMFELLAERKWRHHHGIEALRGTTGFYSAYARRVDALLEQLDAALRLADVDVRSASFVDIAAAEGYVTHHLFDRGASDVDAVEISALNLRRIWMIRAFKQIDSGRVGRVDLDRFDWHRALDRTYDVTLALGIVYHVENPMLFLRNLRAATERIAIIESDTPIIPGNAGFRGFGNLYLHRDQVTIESGVVRYITEMRPDRQALAEMLLAAGFERVELIPPAMTIRSPYFDSGEKSMMVAFT